MRLPLRQPKQIGACLAALCLLAGALLFGQGLYIHAKAALAQVLLERAWSDTLATGTPQKPWPWADTWPVAALAVPRLDERVIVLSGGSGEALAFGPGHLHGTPAPGRGGTSVIAAHRDTHFRFLKDVRSGDTLHVTGMNGDKLSYVVHHRSVVHANDSHIDPAAGHGRLALVTCFPFDSMKPGPLRYVVFADRN